MPLSRVSHVANRPETSIKSITADMFRSYTRDPPGLLHHILYALKKEEGPHIHPCDGTALSDAEINVGNYPVRGVGIVLAVLTRRTLIRVIFCSCVPFLTSARGTTSNRLRHSSKSRLHSCSRSSSRRRMIEASDHDNVHER